jgi:hypothetical protein
MSIRSETKTLHEVLCTICRKGTGELSESEAGALVEAHRQGWQIGPDFEMCPDCRT